MQILRGAAIVAATSMLASQANAAKVLLDAGTAPVGNMGLVFDAFPELTRHRITFISDQPLLIADAFASYGLKLYQWYDWTELGGDSGWYYDGQLQIEVECYGNAPDGVTCRDQATWDPNQHMAMTFLTASSFTVTITEPASFPVVPQVGQDYAEYGGPVYAFMDAIWETEGPANYRIYLTDVPEPTTWALLILGFGGIGVVARRRSMAGA